MRYNKFAHMTCKRGARTWFALLAAALLASGQNAWAFLETGTLLTNSASATYKAGNQATSVSYSATAKILVANPKVFLWKGSSPTFVGVTGGNVTFTLCFSNGGANSAFSVIITDRMPPGVQFVSPTCNPMEDPEDGGDDYGAYQVVGPAPAISYSSTNENGPYTLGCPTPVPWGSTWPAQGYFLQWTIDQLDIKESGCIWYTVTIP